MKSDDLKGQSKARCQRRQLGHADQPAQRPISNGILCLFIIAFLIWLFVTPREAVKSLFAGMAWLSAIYAVVRLIAIFSKKPKDYGAASLSDDLPPYTVLVPLFHEAQMVDPLMRGLAQLRYPSDKLEIVLITECVDPFTTQAVTKAIRNYGHSAFRQVIVPKGTPQTKPRALNFALQSSGGDFVTIYDAEDRPHPDQLLAAVSAFRTRPDWAAVQAPLDYFNHGDNWLTRQFALEYAALFHVWVPFLVRLGLPFPLGGTSNHMRRAPLDAIGGWDSHNVTEDADLSFRLAAVGHRIGFIHPPTQEEAVSIFRDWRYQRARWMKGYIQTWNVHMARPFAPGGIRGFLRFFTLQVTLGLTLVSVLFYTPVVIGLPIIGLILFWVGLPIEVSLTYGLTFGFSMGVGCLIGAAGVHRAKKPELIRAAAFMPVYWLLLFGPLFRAFRELRGQRFHWHKTRHGISKFDLEDTEINAALPSTAQHLENI
ncbi:hypothetical protein GCM10011309_15450 [Litorimonas cladophorae]|uniref:Glycosyltransferase 2-like domain-containing protein n=1 Tax=Litorimonas cladophorae TaxID=1220491 RepID=A0A918KLF5_9PROT|nr:glycosyltransferase family 2 protein [Litorimonas cladophorae]GGX66053.1 hypothetical protein GCM10011309_15450 [Litorimonas cladophorae]